MKPRSVYTCKHTSLGGGTKKEDEKRYSNQKKIVSSTETNINHTLIIQMF